MYVQACRSVMRYCTLGRQAPASQLVGEFGAIPVCDAGAHSPFQKTRAALSGAFEALLKFAIQTKICRGAPLRMYTL